MVEIEMLDVVPTGKVVSCMQEVKGNQAASAVEAKAAALLRCPPYLPGRYLRLLLINSLPLCTPVCSNPTILPTPMGYSNISELRVKKGQLPVHITGRQPQQRRVSFHSYFFSFQVHRDLFL